MVKYEESKSGAYHYFLVSEPKNYGSIYFRSKFRARKQAFWSQITYE